MKVTLLLLFVLTTNCIEFCSPVLFATVGEVKCVASEDLCKNPICKIRTVRKKLSLLNFGCFFPEALENIDLEVEMFKKNANTYTKLINIRQNFCDILTIGANNPVTERIMSGLRDHGFTARACPLKGNFTILDYPVDFSGLAAMSQTGTFKIKAGLIENNGNTSVFKTSVSFSF